MRAAAEPRANVLLKLGRFTDVGRRRWLRAHSNPRCLLARRHRRWRTPGNPPIVKNTLAPRQEAFASIVRWRTCFLPLRGTGWDNRCDPTPPAKRAVWMPTRPKEQDRAARTDWRASLSCRHTILSYRHANMQSHRGDWRSDWRSGRRHHLPGESATARWPSRRLGTRKTRKHQSGSQSLSGDWWRLFPGGRGSRRAATWQFGHNCADSLSRGGPIPAIPGSKPDPSAPRAAQRELGPPLRCGHSGGEFPDRISVPFAGGSPAPMRGDDTFRVIVNDALPRTGACHQRAPQCATIRSCTRTLRSRHRGRPWSSSVLL